jgi:hypothetical protein
MLSLLVAIYQTPLETKKEGKATAVQVSIDSTLSALAPFSKKGSNVLGPNARCPEALCPKGKSQSNLWSLKNLVIKVISGAKKSIT